MPLSKPGCVALEQRPQSGLAALGTATESLPAAAQEFRQLRGMQHALLSLLMQPPLDVMLMTCIAVTAQYHGKVSWHSIMVRYHGTGIINNTIDVLFAESVAICLHGNVANLLVYHPICWCIIQFAGVSSTGQLTSLLHNSMLISS